MNAIQSPCKHKYAVYLSPGYQEKVQWGAYHVTITGFSDSHAFPTRESQKAIVKEIWKNINKGQPYSFRNKVEGKDYWIKPNSQDSFKRKFYAVSFKSGRLDNLAKQLKDKDFQRVKYNWHITLIKAEEKEFNAKQIVDSLKEKDWKLWLVRYPSDECQTKGEGCHPDDWEEI